MAGNILYAQSGGPTAVINASAAGVIRAAQELKKFDKILCSHFGLDGIFKEDFFDLTDISSNQLDLLKNTPASMFGSCRHKLPERSNAAEDYEKIAKIFERYNITCFVYNGGNDSMDTAHKIAEYFAEISFPCNVVGVPKTVDNDLSETHHCPGFGSAAKFVATNMEEIALDTDAYAEGRVTVCEIMGRDAGWLTAASVLANPDLIYLPEVPFFEQKFLTCVEEVYRRKKRCLVAVSEGIADENHNYIGKNGQSDCFGHAQLGGVGYALAHLVKKETGIKTRAIEFSLPTRAAGHLCSLADQIDAYRCGERAVNFAVSGKTDVMVTFVEKFGEIRLDSAPLCKVANVIKKVPKTFITDNGSGISEKFADYVLPLMQGEISRTYQNGVPQYFKRDSLKMYVPTAKK